MTAPRRIALLFLTAVVLALPEPSNAEPLLVCGMSEVFLIDTNTAEKGVVEKLWSWRAKDRPELPESLRSAFGTTDECKPVDGGKRILIAASSGGCALVERPSGRVIWYAQVPNAHSLELLPRDRVIAASSVNEQGNRLALFEIVRSEHPVWEEPLVSAHGVLWDESRQRLWALGLKELRCYELQDWDTDKPSLKLQESYSLPNDDGHDLQAVPKSSDLVLSTGQHVFRFDRDKRQFRPHPVLGDREHVKCVSVHPGTGRTAYVHGSDKAWWGDHIGLLNPSGEAVLQDERLYKVRWLP